MSRSTDGTTATASPLVSVVIPTYYRNDALPDAVRSVLEQTHEPVEVIVVDDSGEAHAEPVVERFDGVEYVPLPENRGSNGARQAGLDRATGEYVHLLDDDDRMRPAKLARQLARFEDAPDDVGVVYTGIEKTGGLTDLPSEDARGEVLDRALAFDLWPCMTSTMLTERATMDAVLPLSDRRHGTDLELMIELAATASFDFVDAALLHKRIDELSVGHSLAAVEARFDIVCEYDHLYDRCPAAVRQRAIANTYETEGQILLKTHRWSPRAVAAFARHLYYLPEVGAKAVLQALASLLGRPGWRIARSVGRYL
ncbi:glycosyltransferase family 2 protein [Haloarcula litorea]|uniref:glycosyltransferase family 2 protein n=1 Tax=Haloarcula litorea TaxID=3032579 RepID=UPI0023E7B4DA|nr:glycosyltransferase family 2 protein [Halomicroarcula sp. GDY20]